MASRLPTQGVPSAKAKTSWKRYWNALGKEGMGAKVVGWRPRPKTAASASTGVAAVSNYRSLVSGHRHPHPISLVYRTSSIYVPVRPCQASPT